MHKVPNGLGGSPVEGPAQPPQAEQVPEFEELKRRQVAARVEGLTKELESLQARFANFDNWAKAEKQRLRDRIAAIENELGNLGSEAEAVGASTQLVQFIGRHKENARKLMRK